MSVAKYTDTFTPDSTAIKQAFYNRRTQELYVEFHRSGSSYAGYADVPLAIWEGFRTASSAGRFYNEYVIDKFDGIDTPGLVLEFDGQTAGEEDALDALVNDDLNAMAPASHSVELTPNGIRIGETVWLGADLATIEAAVSDDKGRVQYVITYTETTADDFAVKANNEDEALVRFWKAMENVPGEVKIVSVTRYYNEE